ncbi:MAG: hypothetical protein ACK4M1_05820 [Flavobacterium sp.]
MKRIILIIFLINIVNCYADEPRYCNKFRSSNKLYEFKITEVKNDSILIDNVYYKQSREIKWGLFNRITNKKIYEIETVASEKTAYVSNNGDYIVIINDWPSETPDDNLEMVSIYKNGSLIKSIKLNEILNCGYNISSSVSHFSWTIEQPKISFTTKNISLVTYELNEIRIDLIDGKITKTKNKLVRENSLLVYGKIIKKNGKNYKLEICHKVFGTLSSPIIEFYSEKEFRTNRYFSILIENGIEINVQYKKRNLNDIILNTCLTEPEKYKEKYLGFGNINCH